MYNKSLLQKYMRCLFDLLALVIGALSFLFSFFGFPKLTLLLCSLSALLCAIYLLYAIYLLCDKVKFDWHLINGHYFRKVICLVILLPSLFVTCINIHYLLISHRNAPQKELVFEESLYAINDSIDESIKTRQESPSLYWSVIYHFVDPGNLHMTTTKTGRTWATLIAIVGIFVFNGLLVTTVIACIDRRKERWMKGEAKYRNILKHNLHYIVIGGNDVVIGIVKQLLEEVDTDNPYILIQTSRDVELFRKELFSTLNTSQQQRIIIYYGNRTSITDISELYIEEAKEVYIIGEDTRVDDIESYHDTMNMECLNLLLENYKTTTIGVQISNTLPKVKEYRTLLANATNNEDKNKIREAHQELEDIWSKRQQLKCRVMFEYQTTFSVFQFYDIEEDVNAFIDFRPFNYYEIWAQKVLINKECNSERLVDNFKNPYNYMPLEGPDGIRINDDNYVHIFIVGMSRMGVAMGVEAAHLAHYPNYEQKKIRTKITFIDKNADEEKDFFMGRFKELFALSHWRYGTIDNKEQLTWCKQHIPTGFEYLGNDFIDIEWEFINGGIETSSIQNYIYNSCNPLAKVTIAICLPESNRSHAAALYINKKIYESDSLLQVLVYNRYGSSIMNTFKGNVSQYPYKGKLKAFGSSANCLAIEYLKTSELIGKYIGIAYNETNKINNITYTGKSKVACRWSNIYNGNTLWTKLRSIGFFNHDFMDDKKFIEVLADVEHNRWVVEQLIMNFRPLTYEEQTKEKQDNNKNKSILKSKMAHIDICSNKKILEIDKDVRKYDIMLTECLFRIHNSM